MVFLRHFGCIYCKEAMNDIRKKREEWKGKNINVILVHMAEEGTAEKYFAEHGISGIEHVANPDCDLYAAFGLTKGTASQLFGLKNWIRGFEVTVIKGNLPGLRRIGDGFQMPGVFLISKGKIMDSYIHASASDRPDYDKLIECCAA